MIYYLIPKSSASVMVQMFLLSFSLLDIRGSEIGFVFAHCLLTLKMVYDLQATNFQTSFHQSGYQTGGQAMGSSFYGSVGARKVGLGLLLKTNADVSSSA
jgi:hypothetical protein